MQYTPSVTKNRQVINLVRTTCSLSDYFPADTEYYYGYPAGANSGFVNLVKPDIEELVAARPFCCAGPNLKILAFGATTAACLTRQLIKNLELPQLPNRQTILLPDTIDSQLTGDARDVAVKAALERHTTMGNFIMAQPYTDEHLAERYQISPQLTAWLNDKRSLRSNLDNKFLPRQLGIYPDGATFGAGQSCLPLPYVAKVSASSAGDGVYICQTNEDALKAAEELTRLHTPIIVESFVSAVKNFAIHFGIPATTAAPIDILGINEQITNQNGEFLGGVIESTTIPAELETITQYLQHDVLPKIRDLGWHGVGGFDILVDQMNNCYVIDGNFRMTGMTAYHFLVANHSITTPLISFTGHFHGSSSKIESTILALAANHPYGKSLKIISLSHHGDTWSFNAAALLHKRTSRAQQISSILSTGIESDGLEQMLKEY